MTAVYTPALIKSVLLHSSGTVGIVTVTGQNMFVFVFYYVYITLQYNKLSHSHSECFKISSQSAEANSMN